MKKWKIISGKRLRELCDANYDKGMEMGYTLGFQMGQVEAANKMYARIVPPKSYVEKQIEDILKRKEE